MKVVNLTPHDVVIYNDEGEIIKTYPKTEEEKVARIQDSITITGEIDGVPVGEITYGAPIDLPEPQDGVYYIVSLVVRQALPHRKDLLSPDTSPAGVVRDEQGRILGTTRFISN